MKVKNNGCCDLKYAKQLKELGVKEESLFFWCEGNSYGDDGISMYCGTYGIIDKTKLDEVTIECFKINPKRELEYYSAFTVAELGEMLGWAYRSGKTGVNTYICNDNFGNKEIEADTEANARAKMLIWLIEQGKVKV